MRHHIAQVDAGAAGHGPAARPPVRARRGRAATCRYRHAGSPEACVRAARACAHQASISASEPSTGTISCGEVVGLAAWDRGRPAPQPSHPGTSARIASASSSSATKKCRQPAAYSAARQARAEAIAIGLHHAGDGAGRMLRAQANASWRRSRRDRLPETCAPARSAAAMARNARGRDRRSG